MIEGRRVVLRSPEKRDFPALQALRNDVDLQLALMALPRANTPSRVEAWLARRLEDPTGLFFIVGLRPSGRFAGFVQLTAMHPVHGTATLGIALAEQARGRGVASEALTLVLRHARAVFRIRKVVLEVVATNRRAIAFYRKEGWRDVGVFREHVWQNGGFRDVVMMEKLLEGRRNPRR